MSDNGLEEIRELAIKHNTPFYEVMQKYTQASNKVYIQNFRKEQLTYGHPRLEEKVFKLTDRYFKIHKKLEIEHA